MLDRRAKNLKSISLITTVKNEEGNIERFLESVIMQTKTPDEFIIVDGGSKDRTIEIIKNYCKKFKWIRLIISNNATIGKGRNIAVLHARNDIIACTDAGCILNKNWLKNITKPFESEKISVVGGIYKGHYTNNFEYFQALSVIPKNFDSPSRISSRSIVFRKSLWKSVNGYPEEFSTGEDTGFNLKIIEKGYNFTIANDAIVHWIMRKNWRDFAKQYYLYGVGDRKLGNIFKMKKNMIMILGFWEYVLSLIITPFVGLGIFSILMFLPMVLFLQEGIRLAFKTKKFEALFYGGSFLLVKRIAYIIGASVE